MYKLWGIIKDDHNNVVYGSWIKSIITNGPTEGPGLRIVFENVGYQVISRVEIVTEQALIEGLPGMDVAFYDPEVMVYSAEDNTSQWASLPESLASYFAQNGFLYWDDEAGVYKPFYAESWADMQHIISLSPREKAV